MKIVTGCIAVVLLVWTPTTLAGPTSKAACNGAQRKYVYENDSELRQGRCGPPGSASCKAVVLAAMWGSGLGAQAKRIGLLRKLDVQLNNLEAVVERAAMRGPIDDILETATQTAFAPIRAAIVRAIKKSVHTAMPTAVDKLKSPALRTQVCSAYGDDVAKRGVATTLTALFYLLSSRDTDDYCRVSGNTSTAPVPDDDQDEAGSCFDSNARRFVEDMLRLDGLVTDGCITRYSYVPTVDVAALWESVQSLKFLDEVAIAECLVTRQNTLTASLESLETSATNLVTMTKLLSEAAILVPVLLPTATEQQILNAIRLSDDVLTKVFSSEIDRSKYRCGERFAREAVLSLSCVDSDAACKNVHPFPVAGDPASDCIRPHDPPSVSSPGAAQPAPQTNSTLSAPATKGDPK